MMQTNKKEIKGLKGREEELNKEYLNKEKLNMDCRVNVPPVLEEIVIEELAVDGICGIY